MKKSILFVNPDYHGAFLYRDAMKAMGWKVDIFVPKGYPEKLLYSKDDIITLKNLPKVLAVFYHFFILLTWISKYKYFIIYGSDTMLPVLPYRLEKMIKEGFAFDLFVLRLFKKRLIYHPSGCLDINLKKDIAMIDDGKICGNCGWGDACDDKRNKLKFSRLSSYFDFYIGIPDIESKYYKQSNIKYKAVDLELWHPDLLIPEKFKLPKTNKLRILHSFFNDNRENNGKNIKGSPYIINAINKLKKEGYNVEYYYVTDVASKDMRYYQAQADIVVEQLIYGWWGSTGVETMALGKPVVCYLRKDAKENFFNAFPEYQSLPIVEANVINIYNILKRLVTDEKYREKKGKESRIFAEKHFDISKNSVELAKKLNEL